MPDEFSEYVARFHHLFHAPEETQFLVAAGNHDMGFHYRYIYVPFSLALP